MLGTIEISVPVGKAADLRVPETRYLSVLRHIAESIPISNRWHAVFSRYLTILAGRVREYGTDPNGVAPNPDGTGKPWTTRPEDSPHDPGDRQHPGDNGEGKGYKGRVRELIYDNCGCFQGFVLVSCGGDTRFFKSTDPGIERVVRTACCDRLQLVVVEDRGHIGRLAIRCC